MNWELFNKKIEIMSRLCAIPATSEENIDRREAIKAELQQVDAQLEGRTSSYVN